MVKVLILCAHRPGRSPSQRYRFEQYLPFLQQNGFEFTWSYLLSEKDDVLFYSRGNFFSKIFILSKSITTRVRDCFRFKNYDIVFVQREANFLGTAYFEKRAARSGARLIFDFDDSIWLADTSPGNKKWEWIKKPGKFFEAISYADTVIAGNEYLAGKARQVNKNVLIIPTTIDTALHIPKPGLRNKNFVTIGWSGSVSTVKHFELLVPVLLKLKEKYGERVKFKLIGDAHYQTRALNVEAVAWTVDTEVDQLNSLDIGIMPLPDDEWAKGKCGLKGLSYMACGVPVVLSPVGVNKQIIWHGENGFLAVTDTDWFEILSQLIGDPALRHKIGEAGRRTVHEKYSVHANESRYLNVFRGSDVPDDRNAQ